MQENIKYIHTPLTMEKVNDLKAGDLVRISGTIYTARDAAHKRFIEVLEENNELPFNITNAIIYYVGPTPAKPDQIIGSAGPTTSYRMDDLTIPLLQNGLKGMIGKGNRSTEIIESLHNYGAVYFVAVGGAAALISKSIKKSEVIAYDDLGAEAVRKLQVKNFPVIVAIDSIGNNMYEIERKKYSV